MTVLAAYYSPRTPVSAIPAGSLTDVIYAFGEPDDDNLCRAPGTFALQHFAELRDLRSKYPHLRLLISIGGYGAAPQYSDIALTPQSRAAFARSCIAQYIQGAGFDGIDLDWEFPVSGGPPQIPRRPQDRANATALFQELRRQLDALGAARRRHYYLTAAIPGGRWQNGGAYDVEQSYDLGAVARFVDWLNVMTYDMNNIFSPVSGFNAPLYEDPADTEPARERSWNNVSASVSYFEQQGVPAQKIVVGMAFYGRGFTGVSPQNAGLYSKYTDGYPEIAWRAIKQRFLPDPAWSRHWDDAAKVPWLYNAQTQTFLTYDSPRSLALKGDFVRRQHLRGAMIWLLGQDDDRQSLLNALHSALYQVQDP